MLLEHLESKLRAIAAQDLTRVLREAEGPTAPRQIVRGPDGRARALLMFCSNDYLGLAAHPRIADALAEGARLYGGGSGASPLVSGHSVAHRRVTDTLADWFSPYIPEARALSFCTGYMANLAVLSALGDAEAEIFSEALNHASLIDGARLARARVSRYGHADVAGLRALLAASTAKVKLIVSDAVFSMDGDIAPLPDLLSLAEEFDAWLIVDDAHGFGTLGERGRGSLEHFEQQAGARGRPMHSERLIVIGTLGKAAGLAGAFVVAHQTVIAYLVQAARNYIFSTASPPAVEHALITSLDLIENEVGQQRRRQLRVLQRQLESGLVALLQRHRGLRWRLAPSETPVRPLIVGGNAEVMELSARLERDGLRVPGIRPPTVPMGEARLRITLCASHTAADVDRLLSALAAAAAEMDGRNA